MNLDNFINHGVEKVDGVIDWLGDAFVELDDGHLDGVLIATLSTLAVAAEATAQYVGHGERRTAARSLGSAVCRGVAAGALLGIDSVLHTRHDEDLLNELTRKPKSRRKRTT